MLSHKVHHLHAPFCDSARAQPLARGALVSVEERHALLIGMYSFNPTYPLSMFQFLKKAETRSGWWPLYSAFVNS